MTVKRTPWPYLLLRLEDVYSQLFSMHLVSAGSSAWYALQSQDKQRKGVGTDHSMLRCEKNWSLDHAMFRCPQGRQ